MATTNKIILKGKFDGEGVPQHITGGHASGLSVGELAVNTSASTATNRGHVYLGVTHTSGSNTTDIGAGNATTVAYNASQTGGVIWVGAPILDEDNLASDSNAHLATQQSIKAYVDAQVTAQDMDITSDSGTIDVDLDSETVTFAGGEGIDTSASGTTVTIAGEEATTSNKGVASFSSDNFAVTSGAVTIKDGGVVTAEIADDAITSAKIADDAVVAAAIADDAVVKAAIADDSVDEARLQVSNSPTNGYALTAQSGNTGGLTWAAMTSGATLSGSTDNTIVTVTGSNAMQGEANLTFDGTDLTIGTNVSLSGGDTAAGDNAAMGYTSAEGLILTGQGSTNDVTIKNDADSTVISIPTGTTNVTIAGDLTISGDDLTMGTNTSGHIMVADGTNFNPVALSGDATINGSGAITLANNSVSQAQLDDDAVGADELAADAVVNASVASNAAIALSKIDTNVDMGGNYTIGSQSDDVATFGGGVTVTGDLTVNGTTTTVNSTTVTVDDPIFTLGGDSAPGSDDNKDRGIEFRYHDGSSARVGFFGYDDSAGVFTGFTAATNTSEVFSGTAMNASFGNIAGTLTTASQTNITGVGTISTGVWNGTAITGDYIDATSSPLANTKIWIGDSNGDAQEFALSGDVTMSAGGAVTIANDAVEQAMIADDAVGADQLAANAVVNASISSSAAIDLDKIDGGSCASTLSDLAQGDLIYAGDVSASNAIKSITFSNLEDAIFGNVSSDITIAGGGAATIANDAVTLAKMAGLARGKIIVGDSSGDPSALAAGANGKLLVADSNGDPSWTTVSGDATLSAGALTVSSIGGDAVTLGGAFTTSGAHTTTLTTSGNTSITLPTTGTLATLAGTETLTNKTIAGGSYTEA